MSRGMQFYSVFVAMLVILVLFKWLYQPGDVRSLNDLLAQDSYLSEYPYHFHVIRVENGTAVMSSPRSAAVSVPEMISAINPELANVSISDPRYQQAQQQLADHQSYARALVLGAEHVSAVQWQLDVGWLKANGIFVPD
ncbi:hypothetical protein [Oceanobacter mangrovi]|uniref:hypothetical protein n=1 Tax=Oceanobacter mangrovi TaxID=2862510 RepID=UPI001C8E149C|nr:hypothetical protein [Oceanobacter mangrovi]